MTTIYVLIAFYPWGGLAMQEFTTQATCEHAATVTMDMSNAYYPISTQCVKK